MPLSNALELNNSYCYICKKLLKNRRSLISHFTKSHRGIEVTTCFMCGTQLTDDNRTKFLTYHICMNCVLDSKEYLKEKTKQRRHKYKQGTNARQRERNKEIRKEVLAHYGSVCACCGEDRYEFLAIDHIDGGGNKHRRKNKLGGGTSFAAWLKRNQYPDEFQILCHNCNSSKGFYGYCPHEVENAIK